MPSRFVLAFVVALVAGCGTEPEPRPLPVAKPAPPMSAELGWRESYPAEGPALRFVVQRLRVSSSGWSVDVAVENDTSIPWRLERRGAGLGFGLLLFADDDLEALEEAGQQGQLPPPRRARSFRPEPPAVLRPNARWMGTMSAPGTLPAGAYARISFGPFVAAEPPPEQMQPNVVWITDHAHRLGPR